MMFPSMTPSRLEGPFKVGNIPDRWWGHPHFSDASLVSRWALQTEEYEGFDVVVADGHIVEFLDRVYDLEIKLGNNTVRDTFDVVDLFDADVELGVQWFITLGKNHHKLPSLGDGVQRQ
jgi:hypothetical protein